MKLQVRAQPRLTEIQADVQTTYIYEEAVLQLFKGLKCGFLIYLRVLIIMKNNKRITL